MNQEIFGNWISSILGLAMVIFAGILLFVETRIDIGTIGISGIAIMGILLIFAKDKLVNILAGKLKAKR